MLTAFAREAPAILLGGTAAQITTTCADCLPAGQQQCVRHISTGVANRERSKHKHLPVLAQHLLLANNTATLLCVNLRAAGVVGPASGRRTPHVQQTPGLDCCLRAVQPRDAAPACTGMSMLIQACGRGCCMKFGKCTCVHFPQCAPRQDHSSPCPSLSDNKRIPHHGAARGRGRYVPRAAGQGVAFASAAAGVHHAPPVCAPGSTVELMPGAASVLLCVHRRCTALSAPACSVNTNSVTWSGSSSSRAWLHLQSWRWSSPQTRPPSCRSRPRTWGRCVCPTRQSDCRQPLPVADSRTCARRARTAAGSRHHPPSTSFSRARVPRCVVTGALRGDNTSPLASG